MRSACARRRYNATRGPGYNGAVYAIFQIVVSPRCTENQDKITPVTNATALPIFLLQYLNSKCPIVLRG